MDHLLLALFMLVLILANAFMAVVFVASQRQGLAFIASVNKAFEWGSCFLVFGCCLNTAVYMS
jgi:hypothetical protein